MIQEIPVAQASKSPLAQANRRLQMISRLLFAIGVLGQWAFAYYIVVFYGGIAKNGTYEKVNEQLGHGIIEGDGLGNLMLGAHLFLAAIITLGGPLQFIARIRNQFPTFHRWNGRLYLSTALLGALTGLYMIYSRGAHGGLPMLLGNSLNATLIIVFSILTIRSALQKHFVQHQQWALRAFLMISGVWFIRIGYGLWIFLTGFTAPGSNENLTGPFDVFLALTHSLIPLLIIEIYFWAKATRQVGSKKIAVVFFGLLSVLLAIGVVMAGVVFWWSRL